MKVFFSYILKCADGTLYSGFTTDPKKRLIVHNSGEGARYTRLRRPVRAVSLWQWHDKSSALSAEWHVKRLTRQKKIQLILTPQSILQLCKKTPVRIFTEKQLDEINSSAHDAPARAIKAFSGKGCEGTCEKKPAKQRMPR